MSLDLETDDRRALLARGLRRAGRQSLSAAHALWKRDWGEALHFGHRATVGLGLFAGAAGVSYEEYSRSRRKTS